MHYPSCHGLFLILVGDEVFASLVLQRDHPHWHHMKKRSKYAQRDSVVFVV